jgi:outer membrane usher protein
MPYTSNRIAIDPSSLPVDTRIDLTSLDIVPRQYAGVVARFALERYAAATVMVVKPDGKPIDVGTPARLEGAAQGALVGYDGVLFVEGLRAQNRVLVGVGKDACEVRFAYQSVAGELPTIGPLVCQPVQGEPK